MKIRQVGIRVVSCGTDGRTDRHDEANSRFSQFCERAKKREKNVFFIDGGM